MTDIKAIVTDDGQIIEHSQIVGQLIICRPSVIMRKVEKQKCPTCGKDQAFLIEHIAWYGQDATCLVCGDRWQDGELCPRPFARGWRRQNVKHALERLNRPVDPDPFQNMESEDEDFEMGEQYNPSKWLKTV